MQTSFIWKKGECIPITYAPDKHTLSSQILYANIAERDFTAN